MWELIRNANSCEPILLIFLRAWRQMTMQLPFMVRSYPSDPLSFWAEIAPVLACVLCAQLLLLGEVPSLADGELSKCLLNEWMNDTKVIGRQNHKVLQCLRSVATLPRSKSWLLHSWFCDPRQLLSLCACWQNKHSNGPNFVGPACGFDALILISTLNNAWHLVSTHYYKY